VPPPNPQGMVMDHRYAENIVSEWKVIFVNKVKLKMTGQDIQRIARKVQEYGRLITTEPGTDKWRKLLSPGKPEKSPGKQVSQTHQPAQNVTEPPRK